MCTVCSYCSRVPCDSWFVLSGRVCAVDDRVDNGAVEGELVIRYHLYISSIY